MDQDYLHQLSEKEKAWLNKFMDEELNARFEKDGSDFNQSQEDRKRIYDANNARNRCLYGRVKNRVGSTKILDVEQYANLVEDELSASANKDSLEDTLIEFIDHSKLSDDLNDGGDDSGQGK